MLDKCILYKSIFANFANCIKYRWILSDAPILIVIKDKISNIRIYKNIKSIYCNHLGYVKIYKMLIDTSNIYLFVKRLNVSFLLRIFS